MRVSINVKKTVALFLAIHLMIAWVAERRGVKAEKQIFSAKSTVLANKTNKTDKQYDILKTQP